MNNYNLCHIKTIEWKEIISGPGDRYLYVYMFKEPERCCVPCHESCAAGCWGEGAHNCQKFSKLNCSPQCHGGKTFPSTCSKTRAPAQYHATQPTPYRPNLVQRLEKILNQIQKIKIKNQNQIQKIQKIYN